jgi:tetratricopeptide (TPR) repeat protein
MSFKGDIQSISLGDVVQNLASNQKTGTLVIGAGSGQPMRYVQFRDGRIVSYTDEGFSILAWLLDKGIVPDDLRSEVVRRSTNAKRKTLGEILRDMEIIGLDSYTSYLADLVRETLYEVLTIREGSFEFLEGNLDEKYGDREVSAYPLDFNPTSIVMETACRADDWQKIRRHIPSEHEIYAPPRGERARLIEEASDDVSKAALDLMDGTRSLKQVIRRLPYSRFDACRAIAGLIAEKKVRPLDGDFAMQDAAAEGDPREVIARLKAILEREPNNREVLKRLADLEERVGNRGESAVHRKFLAISYLEEGDLAQGEASLRRSIELNSKDITTWQKLWDTVRRQNDREKAAAVGAEFAEHFKRLGLMEIVRDHLLELVKLFPERVRFRIDLAEARFALGNRKAAVRDLFDLANDLVKKSRLDDAQKVFERILTYDRDNRRARDFLEKIRSGKLARWRADRRRFVHTAVHLGLFLALFTYLSFELYVRGELLQATKIVFAQSLLEERRYDEAIERVEAVRDAYPFSITAVYEIPRILEILGEKRSDAAAGTAKPAAPPAKAAATNAKAAPPRR